jgi:protocatechuate 3,4-dioxygenase beta subunit
VSRAFFLLGQTGVVRSDETIVRSIVSGMPSAAPLSPAKLERISQADGSGRVSFTSVFPACYQGRWPHIHFEVYPTLAAATNVSNKIATSQIALPKAVCDQVYATPGYEQSIVTLSQVSLATDMVFADGVNLELATISGTVGGGLTAALTVAI